MFERSAQEISQVILNSKEPVEGMCITGLIRQIDSLGIASASATVDLLR